MPDSSSSSSSAGPISPLSSSSPRPIPAILLNQTSGEPEIQASASPSSRDEQEASLPSSKQASTPAKTGELPLCTSTASRNLPSKVGDISSSGIARRKTASTSSRPIGWAPS